MKYKKGFTLLELLVVLSILGLIIAVVIPSLSSAKNKAADARVKSTLSELALKLEEQEIAPGVIDYERAFVNTQSIEKIESLATELGVDSFEYKVVQNGYFVAFPLRNGKYWCIDSNRTMEEVSGLGSVDNPTCGENVARGPAGGDTGQSNIPTLTLNGQNPLVFSFDPGDNISKYYTELGAVARDAKGNDISENIKTSELTYVGYLQGCAYELYFVTYTVTSDGITLNKTRDIKTPRSECAPPPPPPPPADPIPVEVPTLVLNGQNPIVLDFDPGDNILKYYSEPGATATDSKGGDISDSIKISDPEISEKDNCDKKVYVVTYVVESNGLVIEKIREIITTRENPEGCPTLKLIGENPMVFSFDPGDYILKYYLEPGAAAYDSKGNEISDSIKISDPIFQETELSNCADKIYFVTYTVYSEGMSLTKTREIRTPQEGCPILKLNGENPVLLSEDPYDSLEKFYSEPGATAFDPKGYDISNSIKISEPIYQDSCGDKVFIVTYTLNSGDNELIKTREIRAPRDEDC